MEQNINNKTELKDKLESFYNTNKYKIFVISCLLIIIFISIFFLKINNEKNNSLVAEKYIKAGLYLASSEKEKSKIIYKDIVLSKNKLYSSLALNNILENNLEPNRDEVLKLFDIVENTRMKKEQKNLVKLKKALYLMKQSMSKEGEELLKEIISSNSVWKKIALEVSK